MHVDMMHFLQCVLSILIHFQCAHERIHAIMDISENISQVRWVININQDNTTILRIIHMLVMRTVVSSSCLTFQSSPPLTLMSFFETSLSTVIKLVIINSFQICFPYWLTVYMKTAYNQNPSACREWNEHLLLYLFPMHPMFNHQIIVFSTCPHHPRLYVHYA